MSDMLYSCLCSAGEINLSIVWEGTQGPNEVTQPGPCSGTHSVPRVPGVQLSGHGVFAWSLERCDLH